MAMLRVLSFDPSGQTLVGHEMALRASGYVVVSVATAIQARYEGESGTSGIFLISHLVPRIVCVDLVHLFRRHCPAGVVVFFANDTDARLLGADIVAFEHDDPRIMIRKLANLQTKAS